MNRKQFHMMQRRIKFCRCGLGEDRIYWHSGMVAPVMLKSTTCVCSEATLELAEKMYNRMLEAKK